MKFDQIRRVRKAAHVTQEELAKRIGVNRALISKYETGIIEPSVSQLQKIALALGVHPMEIYGDSALGLIDYGMDLFARALETPGAQALKKINENSAVNTLGRLYTQDKKQEMQLDRILYAFSQLNEEGKEEAAKRIDELAEIPRYRRTEP